MKNEIKYTSDGRKVVVLGSLNSTDKIVQEIFVVDGSEIPSGEHFVVKSLHDAPAVSWKEKNLKDIEVNYDRQKLQFEREIESLKKSFCEQRDRLRLQIETMGTSLKRVNEGLLDSLSKIMLFDIKYVVVCSSYSFPVIQKYDDFKIHNEFGIRLVSIYGKPDGHLSIKINEYSDGSGSSNRVEFFSTYEDALSFVGQFISEKSKYNGDDISGLVKLGLPVDPVKKEEYKNRIIAEKKASLAELTERVAAMNIDIEKLESL